MKRAFKMKYRAIFIIFKRFSIAKSCLKPQTAFLTILAIKRGLSWNFAKSLKGCQVMGHSGTGLKSSATIDL